MDGYGGDREIHLHQPPVTYHFNASLSHSHFKLDGKYSERVQLPTKAKFGVLSPTLATHTIRSLLSLYLHDISKTNAARITRLDTEMFYHDSWKPIYSRVKGEGQHHDEQTAAMGFSVAGFF